jgi:hypothetical protein
MSIVSACVGCAVVGRSLQGERLFHQAAARANRWRWFILRLMPLEEFADRFDRDRRGFRSVPALNSVGRPAQPRPVLPRAASDSPGPCVSVNRAHTRGFLSILRKRQKSADWMVERVEFELSVDFTIG